MRDTRVRGNVITILCTKHEHKTNIYARSIKRDIRLSTDGSDLFYVVSRSYSNVESC